MYKCNSLCIYICVLCLTVYLIYTSCLFDSPHSNLHSHAASVKLFLRMNVTHRLLFERPVRVIILV